jgi:hypothetical protein
VRASAEDNASTAVVHPGLADGSRRPG